MDKTYVFDTAENKCGCNAHTQLFTEDFVVAFQGRTALPTKQKRKKS